MGWISVEDTLPIDGQIVDVWIDRPYVTKDRVADVVFEFSPGGIALFDTREREYITHWMPRPEPPKGSEDDFLWGVVTALIIVKQSDDSVTAASIVNSVGGLSAIKKVIEKHGDEVELELLDWIKGEPKVINAAQGDEQMVKLSERVASAIRPKPMCRDCADFGPRCPNSGELCSPNESAEELGALVAQLEQENGLLKIALDDKKTLLDSCEKALSERDKAAEELRKENAELRAAVDWLHNYLENQDLLLRKESKIFLWVEAGWVMHKTPSQHLNDVKARAVDEFGEQHPSATVGLTAKYYAKQLREKTNA